MQKVNIQLYGVGAGVMAGEMITAAGGVCYVAKSGDAQKETLLKKDGTAQANPVSMTNGGAEFYVANTVNAVDLYIMAPGGQFLVKTGVVPGSGGYDFAVDTQQLNQVAKIPFSIADTTAATETDTGFDFPLYAAVLPTPLVRITTADAAITLEAGLKSSETAGDADGFIDAVSCATVGLVRATIANAGNTLGALFEVQDSVNAGDLTHEAHVITGSNAVSITYTLLAAADTAEGFLILPYILTA